MRIYRKSIYNKVSFRYYWGDRMICINKYGILEIRENPEESDMEMIGSGLMD